MDRSTWAAVWIGAAFITLTLVVYAGSLIPPDTRRNLRGAARVELASWPDQWRQLRADVASWTSLPGRHAPGALPAADLPRDPDPRPFKPAPDPTPAVPVHVDDRSEDVVVIRDDSVTEVLPVVAERTEDGATEDWSPMAEVEAVETIAPNVTAAHTPPDLTELTLLADFDAIVSVLRAVPKELVAFAEVVDASMEKAKMDGELHRRWRATAFDVPTGEYRLALAAA